jgi:hypothetical protein
MPKRKHIDTTQPTRELSNTETETKKRKKSTRLSKKQQPPNTFEITKTVKTKLNTILQDKYRQFYLQEMPPVVDAFSRLMADAAVLANLVVAKWFQPLSETTTDKCFHTLVEQCPFQLDQQFFRDCCSAILGRKVKTNIVTEVQALMNYQFPLMDVITGLSQFTASLAKLMAVNASNHIVFALLGRQRKLIRSQFSLLKSPQIYEIQTCINRSENYDAEEFKHCEEVKNFVLFHRSLINPHNQLVDETYLTTQLNRGLGYQAVLMLQFNITQQTQPLDKLKRVCSFLPLRAYRKSFIPIHSDLLWNLQKKFKKTELDKTTFSEGENQMKHWNEVFRIKPPTKKWKFRFSLYTNGVVCNLLFVRYVPKPATTQNKTKYKEPLVSLENKTTGVYNERQVSPSNPDKLHVIGCDPGGQILLSMFDFESKKTWTFTKSQYYAECGFHVAKKRREKKDAKASQDVKDALKKMQSTSYRSHIFASLLETWETRKSIADLLWAHHASKENANQEFSSYVKKQKSYEKLKKRIAQEGKQGKLENQEKQPSKQIVLAYGNASFNHAYKGSVSGPRTELIKQLSERFPIVLVDEFRSSKCCSSCGEVMNQTKIPVHQCQNEKRVSVFRCETCNQYRHRDRNAARNMAYFLDWTLHKEGIRSDFQGNASYFTYRKGKLSRSISLSSSFSSEVTTK